MFALDLRRERVADPHRADDCVWRRGARIPLIGVHRARLVAHDDSGTDPVARPLLGGLASK
jgi:hypothetical protein